MNISKELITKLDSDGMWNLLREFPNHWQEVMELTDGWNPEVLSTEINGICFTGMGGSAIGADLIRTYVADTAPVPIQVVRHYELPAWVNEDTLVVGCSFSGNTEETLTAFQEAGRRGAKRLAVTTGGKLLQIAQKEDFDYMKIPGGMPPRAALAYSFVPLYRIIQQLGWTPEDAEAALAETHSYLSDQIAILSDEEGNEALEIAQDLVETLPIIYCDGYRMEPVQLRWRGQMEENAKTLAYGNVFPEMNHNEIVGWEQISHLTGRLSVVMLTDADDYERVGHRMEITESLINDQAASLHVLKSRGESRLTRMFSLVQLGDWVSMYLAMLTNVDPTPIAKIDLLKSRLADLD
jgi:glucose/mannose-6-phosphate isomerase